MTTVLDAHDHRSEWMRRWEECGREPFAHPAYVELYATEGARAIALAVDYVDGSALVPLLIRPVRTSSDGPDFYDAASPYGYGGPFFSGRRDSEVVLSGLRRWATQAALCSVFLRLSLDVPVPVSGRTSGFEIVEASNNVVVELRREPPRIWSDYDHKVRKNVRKAIRAGCAVQRDNGFEDVSDFVSVYEATMRRRGAAAQYHYGRSFFLELAQELPGSYSVFSVLDADGRVVSVELVLEGSRYLYSFLGGTLAEAFPMAPNDLLKHEVILYGHRTGRDGYVLGGGYDGDDGIFRYKRSFDAGGILTFRTARLIADRAEYEKLVSARRLDGSMSASNSNFFPAYRAP